MGKLDDVEHPVRPSQVHQDVSDTEEEDKDGDDFCGSGDRPSPFCLGETKDRRDECSRMADSDEKDKIGDINPPEDRPCKSGDAKSVAVLIEVGHDAPKDDGNQDEKGEVKGLPVFLMGSNRMASSSNFNPFSSITFPLKGR